MTDLDLQQEIDRSFGNGPAHRDLEQRIVAGRRTVRRRRVAAAGAVLAVAAVVGAVYDATGPIARPDGEGQVAVDPPSGSPEADPWIGPEYVRYVDGELKVRPGVVVHEHIENPYGVDPPALSDALDLTFRGQHRWVIIDSDGDGGFGTSAALPLVDDYDSFAEYVAARARDHAPPDRELLVLDGSGQVVAARGAEVLQRTDAPRFDESWSRPASSTGAALVRSERDGRAYFYAWRVVAGSLQLFPSPPAEAVGATFPELVSAARDRLASEGER